MSALRPADEATAPDKTATPLPRSPRRPRAVRRAWRRRLGERHPAAARALSAAVTVLAAALVVAALVMPDSVEHLDPAAFLRIPAEAVVGAAVLPALARRPRVAVAAVSGVLLGAVAVLNALDMGFGQYLGREFDVVLDWGLLGDAESYLEDSLGRTATLAAVAGCSPWSCCSSCCRRWPWSG